MKSLGGMRDWLMWLYVKVTVVGMALTGVGRSPGR
jgi:hypothetical protein